MKFSRLFTLALALLFVMPAYATDGYFSLGYGTRNKGLAGAGVGLYHTSLINGNPAGLFNLGKNYTIGVTLFSPFREYTITGNPSGMPTTFGLTPGTVESDSKLFVIPHIGANWTISNSNSFSIALYGNGGMNTNYPTATFYDQSSETTGVDLAQVFSSFSFSQKLSDNHFLGVSGILSYQYFEAKGLNSFGQFGMSSDPENLSNNGSDNSFGYGFKVGYLGSLSENFSVGASYQSKIWMSEFENYAGLFAEAGDFDIPSSWTAGIAYDVSDWTFLFDVKQILYSGVPAVSNPIDPLALPPAFLNPGGDPNNPNDYTPNPNYTPLGSDNGSGFGWDDMTILKFGFEYGGVQDWILRGGFSHGNQPIATSEAMFNILAPGVIENHLTLGFSKNLGKGNKMVNFALVYAFSNTVNGPNPFDFDPEQAMNGVFVPNQDIALKMNQFEIEVGISF